jgi:hypothetical protein
MENLFTWPGMVKRYGHEPLWRHRGVVRRDTEHTLAVGLPHVCETRRNLDDLAILGEGEGVEPGRPHRTAFTTGPEQGRLDRQVLKAGQSVEVLDDVVAALHDLVEGGEQATQSGDSFHRDTPCHLIRDRARTRGRGFPPTVANP